MAKQDRSTILANPGELDPAFADKGIYPVLGYAGSIRSIAADAQGRLTLAVWTSTVIVLSRILSLIHI